MQALRGMTPQLYARLEPWICALPDAILSPINVNTLLPEQAPLIMMLAPGQITLDRARGLIAQRPPLGYARIADFWRPLALQSQTFGPEIESQPQIVTPLVRAGSGDRAGRSALAADQPARRAAHARHGSSRAGSASRDARHNLIAFTASDLPHFRLHCGHAL